LERVSLLFVKADSNSSELISPSPLVSSEDMMRSAKLSVVSELALEDELEESL
jgi:hypothetical protein